MIMLFIKSTLPVLPWTEHETVRPFWFTVFVCPFLSMAPPLPLVGPTCGLGWPLPDAEAKLRGRLWRGAPSTSLGHPIPSQSQAKAERSEAPQERVVTMTDGMRIRGTRFESTLWTRGGASSFGFAPSLAEEAFPLARRHISRRL